MNDRYLKTKHFVKQYMLDDSMTDREKSNRYEHTLRVATIGREIAKQEQQDEEIIVLACLLHDVGKFETNMEKEHGRISARIARPFLHTLDLSQETIDRICYAIAVHVDGKADFEHENFVEADTVSDCNYIDRFAINQAVEMMEWREFSYMDTVSGLEFLEQQLAHLDKLQKLTLSTATATKLFSYNLNLQKQLYQHLRNQYQYTYSFFHQ